MRNWIKGTVVVVDDDSVLLQILTFLAISRHACKVQALIVAADQRQVHGF
ncbi:MAG: hypothetical protein ACOH1I_04190 [Gallionellaceae bacterium]|jgi:hypothetical protein